jgi:hypothetical protein
MMPSMSPTSPATCCERRRRGGTVALSLLLLGSAAPFLCGDLACGNLGEPAFAGSDGGGAASSLPTFSAATSDAAEDEEGGAPKVLLAGTARGSSGEPIAALVAVEVGGLNQENPGAVGPDGAVEPTLRINPFYQYGTRADEGGEFSLKVPEEELGIHAYAGGFYCGVPEAGTIDPASGTTLTLRLRPLAEDGGTPPPQPTITSFTVTPEVVPPGGTLTMSALVEAVDPEHDPLSEQVLAIEPISNWAGIFAPPVPGTPGRGYPNGAYNRLVLAPVAPGEYVYYLVAATQACVVSEPVTARVLVTPTGEGGLENETESEAESESGGPEADAFLEASKETSSEAQGAQREGAAE